MAPLEILPLTVFLLVATPLALIAREWFRHRSVVAKENAETERVRMAFERSPNGELVEVLKALKGPENPDSDAGPETG